MDVELAKANEVLGLKQAELNIVVKKVNELESLYTENKKEKEKLDNDIK